MMLKVKEKVQIRIDLKKRWIKPPLNGEDLKKNQVDTGSLGRGKKVVGIPKCCRLSNWGIQEGDWLIFVVRHITHDEIDEKQN